MNTEEQVCTPLVGGRSNHPHFCGPVFLFCCRTQQTNTSWTCRLHLGFDGQGVPSVCLISCLRLLYTLDAVPVLSHTRRPMQDVMQQDFTSQSKPVLLFFQQGLANYRRVARDLCLRRNNDLNGSPSKGAALWHSSIRSLRSKIGLPCGSLPMASGLSNAETDSRGSGGGSSALSRDMSPSRPPVPPRAASISASPSANPLSDAECASSPRSASFLVKSVSSNSLSRSHNMPPAGADSGNALPRRDGVVEDVADLALFQVLVRMGKALYPAKKTWVTTAYHVSTWLGIPRTAREGLHAVLRQTLFGEAPIAALLSTLKVCCLSHQHGACAPQGCTNVHPCGARSDVFLQQGQWMHKCGQDS
jgi:hypothetical protein